MRLDFVTLFPEQVINALSHSMTKRAQEAGLVHIRAANPRDFATDAHKTVDDKPYGGGPGMVMKAPIVDAALQSLAPSPTAAIVITDPTGELFDQDAAASLSQCDHVIFVCGHYEGIDERFAELRCTHRFSIGDFVLTGGELPALVMADSVIRLIPGVLGDPESLDIDSHSDGLLGAPQYTRPENWEGLDVPDVLRSGDHQKVEKWKRQWSLKSTRSRRPDLFAQATLEKGDADMLSF